MGGGRRAPTPVRGLRDHLSHFSFFGLKHFQLMACSHFSEVSPSEWVYQQPRKTKNGGVSINLQKSAAHLSAPRVQLERLRCPFGVQDGLEVSSRQNLEVAVSLDSIRAWTTMLDEQNLQWIVANSVLLFKKEMKRATVDALYRPLLTSPSNAAYDPLLRLKINKDGPQATNVMIVMQEGNADAPMKWRHGTLDEIERHSEVIPIVEVSGLWFVSKACGMTLVATDLLVFPRRRRGFDFIIPFANGAVMCDAVEERDAAAATRESNQPEASVISSMFGGAGGDRPGATSAAPPRAGIFHTRQQSPPPVTDLYDDNDGMMNTGSDN
jgi:hypothetical protein